MQPRRHQHQHCLPFDGGAAVTPPPPTSSEFKRGKKRGSYNCGRCGVPKKGHVCHLSPDESSDAAITPAESSSTTAFAASSRRAIPPPPPAVARASQPYLSHLRRALSFDDVDNGGFDAAAAEDEDEEEEDEDGGGGDEIFGGGLPGSCLWEVLRRLTPAELLSAAKVCRGWRATTRRLWKAAEVLKLRVPARAQVGLVGSMLQKCPSLVSLSLRMERYQRFRIEIDLFLQI